MSSSSSQSSGTAIAGSIGADGPSIWIYIVGGVVAVVALIVIFKR